MSQPLPRRARRPGLPRLLRQELTLDPALRLEAEAASSHDAAGLGPAYAEGPAFRLGIQPLVAPDLFAEPELLPPEQAIPPEMMGELVDIPRPAEAPDVSAPERAVPPRMAGEPLERERTEEVSAQEPPEMEGERAASPQPEQASAPEEIPTPVPPERAIPPRMMGTRVIVPPAPARAAEEGRGTAGMIEQEQQNLVPLAEEEARIRAEGAASIAAIRTPGAASPTEQAAAAGEEVARQPMPERQIPPALAGRPTPIEPAEEEAAAAPGEQAAQEAGQAGAGEAEGAAETPDPLQAATGELAVPPPPPESAPDPGALGRQSMTQVRRQIRARARAVPTPVITRGTQAVREAQTQGQAAQSNLQARGAAAPESARRAVPPVPQGVPTDVRPLEHPVPEAHTALEAASNRSLTEQTLPGLERTPGGNLPQLGSQPLSPGLLRSMYHILEEGPQVSDPADVQRTHLLKLRMNLETQAPVTEGEGQPVTLRQPPPPPPRPPLTRERRSQLGRVIARLLANTGPEATSMVNRARAAAFTRSVLTTLDATRTLGETDLVPELTNALDTQLRAIASEAGLAEEDVQTALDERRQQLEEERRRGEERLQVCLPPETEAISQASRSASNAIAGSRSAVDRQAEAVQAVTMTDRAAFISTRRDNLINEVTNTVGQQTANYRLASERRQSDLNRAEQQQIAAYGFAIQQDEFQLNLRRGERTQLQVQEDVAARRTWLTNKTRSLRSTFGTLKTSASDESERFRSGIELAGQRARELLRQWAEREGAGERTFWQRIKDLVNDWLNRARANADAWQTLQNQETATATLGYLDMMDQVQTAAQGGITREQIEGHNKLNNEERTIIRAYFDPQSGGDVVSAVAEGLRQRIQNERADDLKTRIENLVYNGSLDLNTLNAIGKAYDVSFDAFIRASSIYRALHPGWTGWGTEEDEAYAAMTGLNRIQAAAVRAVYKERYHIDLDEDIESEFSGGEKNRAVALMSGDTNRAAAAALYSAMHETVLMTGLGTDRDVIMNTLRGKTPEQIAEITRIYEETYGGNLREQLGEELNDWATLTEHDADIATAYMDSNPALADAIEADRALHGFSWGYAFNLAYGTQFEEGSRDEFTAIYDRIRREVSEQATREQWTDAQYQAEVTRRTMEVERLYDQRYGTTWGTLSSNVHERFTENNLSLVQGYMNNDQTRIDMARVAIERNSLVYASDDAIITTLEGNYDRALEATRRDLEPDLRRRKMAQIQQEERAFFQEHGRNWTPAEMQERTLRMEAEIRQELEQAALPRAQRSMARLDELYRTEQGESLSQAVEATTGNSFLGIGGDNQEHALTALNQAGYLTRYQRFDYAVRGGGTREEAAQRAIQGASHAELADMRRRWAQEHPGETLDDRALSELSGKDAMDMQINLMGEPETVKDRVAIERERVRLEQPTNFLGGQIAGPEREIMQMRLQQLEAISQQMHRTDLSQEERDRMVEDFNYHAEATQRAAERHRETVAALTDSIANTAAMVVALAVGAIGSVFTGGASMAVALAVVASLAATATSIATRALLMGNQYGHEELLTDIGIGAVDAIMAALTAGLGEALLEATQAARAAAPALRAAATPALRGGLRGVMQSFRQALGGTARFLGLDAAEGVITRIAPRGLLSGLRSRPFYGRTAAWLISESVENVVSSIPSAVLGNVIDDRNWQGGFQFGNVLRGVALQVGQGVGTGLAFSAGTRVGGRALGGLGNVLGAGWRFLRGPQLGAEPRLRSPELLPHNEASYRSALQEFQRLNPGRSEADFRTLVQGEWAAHQRDFLAANPGKTPADFEAFLRDLHEARRNAFQESRPRGDPAELDAQAGRESAAALSGVDQAQAARRQARAELVDALPSDLQGNVRDVPITQVSAREFTRLTGRLTGDAAIVVRNGQVHLVIREGAPASAVRGLAARLAGMVESGTGGRTRNPAEALPRDLRNRVQVYPNPDLAPGTARVHFEAQEGVILGVWLEIGPGTRAVDIHQHVGTMRALRDLQGMSRLARSLRDRIRTWRGLGIEPRPGELGFEARLEVGKLPDIIQERAQRLLRATSPEEQLRLAFQIENLRQQLETHARNVDSVESGRGFVAAEILSPAEARARIEALPEEVRARVEAMDPAERTQMLSHSTSFPDVESFARAWLAIADTEVATGVPTAALVARAAASTNPAAFLQGLEHIATLMEGPDRTEIFNRVRDQRFYMSPEFAQGLGELARLRTSTDPEVARFARSADMRTFLASALIAATEPEAMIGGFLRLVDARIPNRTLEHLVSTAYYLGPESMGRFITQAASLAERINVLSKENPEIGRLLSPLLEGTGESPMFSSYLGNIRALVDAIATRARQEDGAEAIQPLIEYAQSARRGGDPAVAFDLASAGRRVSEASDTSLGEIFRGFNNRLTAAPPRRLSSRATWDERVASAQRAYARAVEAAAPDQKAQVQALVDGIEDATPAAQGWTEGHRAMIFQQQGWLLALARAQGESPADLVRSLIDAPFGREAEYDTFRRGLREALLDRIFADGNDRPDTALLRTALDNSADSGAKGALFDRYMKRRLGRLPGADSLLQVGESSITGLRAGTEGSPSLRILADGVVSHADDVAVVTTDLKPVGCPPEGRILLDYKAGPGAFRADQAAQYMRHLAENGGSIQDARGVHHNGLAYIADSEGHADAAMREVAELIRKNYPGQERLMNMFFGYQQPDGTIAWIERTWRSEPPSQSPEGPAGGPANE